MSQIIIQAERLSKYYGGFPAIRDVSFSIHEGEIVGLLGLNGAGKSTILKILGCFLLPSTGRASIAGHWVETDADAVRALIGYLPDTPPLYSEMTVESFLNYVARLKNVRPGEVVQHVAQAMERCNLNEMKECRLKELSHGFRQRVGIAQAIVHRPKVLIFDEPINGLDPLQIAEMRDLILSFRGTHTVILSSHILSEVTKTCDRILIIDQGQVVAEGAEKELEQKLAGKGQIRCQVAQLQHGFVDRLRALPTVKNVRVESLGNATENLFLEAEGEIRPQLARMIIESGGDLLALDREEAGLEKLFVQLIQANSGRQQHL